MRVLFRGITGYIVSLNESGKDLSSGAHSEEEKRTRIYVLYELILMGGTYW